MRKLIAILLSVIMIFSLVVFTGCDEDEQGTDENDQIRSEFVYVLWVGENSFIAGLINDEKTWIKCEGIGDEIDVFDTVLVEYDINAVEKSMGLSENGEDLYYYIIHKVVNVRLADPDKGEHLFG